jgi:hypothetical protein
MKLPAPPSIAELTTPHFDEFCGLAADYYAKVDPAELAKSVTLDDLRQGIWRPYGFIAIHGLSATEENERQLRLHVWTTLGMDTAPVQAPDATAHRHGAHLAGKAIWKNYVERLVGVRPATVADQDTYTNFTHQGNDWVDTGDVVASVGGLDQYPQDSAHFIAADRYHITPVIPAPLGLTLVIRGKVFMPSAFLQPSHISSPLVFPPQEPMPESTLAQVWNELQLVRETLDNNTYY